MFDDVEEDGGMYYNPEAYDKFDQDKILDEESGITFGEMNESLRRLSVEHGNNGPFTEEEVCNAVTSLIVGDSLKSLEEKGLITSYMDRSGQIVYKATELGNKVSDELNKDLP